MQSQITGVGSERRGGLIVAKLDSECPVRTSLGFDRWQACLCSHPRQGTLFSHLCLSPPPRNINW